MYRLLFAAKIIFISYLGSLYSYAYNPHVPIEIWNDLAPYFLPEGHPIKMKLDTLVAKRRITHSAANLKKAGFKIVSRGYRNHAIVAKHRKMKGYLIKVYTDEQAVGCEWADWKKRVIGAHVVKNAINRLNYQKYFKVPQKWIYPLPSEPSPAAGLVRKDFILVVEDMKILNREKNAVFWRSIAIDEARLTAIYTILKEEGLFDSVYIDNLPFCRDGKQAFVDTQHFQSAHVVEFGKFIPFLRPAMQAFLMKLMTERP